ncbi:VPS4-associated protein 1 [Lactifluus subvellereus]|nr:VPS4-associated protein 1 [Lactifluus subvellereus]
MAGPGRAFATMSFQNVYYKRATATPRACYVCSKPTTTCLATANAVDFIYTCEAHLSDTGFATEIVDPNAPKEVVSQEEIARIKAEWEAKEARKKDKAEAAAKGASGSGGPNSTGGEGKKEEEGKDNNTAKSPSPSVPGALHSPSAASSAPATPTHKRYSLHRDFYAMRQAEHRRRRKAKQTQELAPRLPGAPQGSLAG